MGNRLLKSKSAYLRSAAHQPVDWHEFNDEAFQKAQDSDKLILLDIGAVWCHWCHVIDRESYENDEIAALINADYIPVKVDRDQRPDIDARYQQVVQSMTGQGGWPLTAFLTPDGRLLYGGTYFPPAGMKRLLEKLKDLYQDQKAEINEDALNSVSIAEYKARLTEAEAEEILYPIPDQVFERGLDEADNTYDPVYGGFGRAPKFPHFSTLQFLIQQAFHTQDPQLTAMIEKTLIQMAQGGIYDQLAGGFHRYSVDEHWHVPHFEKMAYDNAEALKIYAQAYRMLGNPLFRQTAEGIWQFLQHILSGPEGFYASQDADIDLDDDGDYFTWTPQEIKAVLSAKDAKAVISHYGMTAKGDMHGRPGRNVLQIVKPTDSLEKAKAELLAHRQTRPTPFIDTTVYLNWNGMILSAAMEAADLLDHADMRRFAQTILDTLLKTHVKKNRLLHTPGVDGLLEDYAWFIQALLKAYQSTQEAHYLEAAIRWTDIACDRFEDKKFGGFWDIEEPDETTLALLRFRRKPTDDSPSSSANGIMAQNLVALTYLSDDPEKYSQKADKLFNSFGQVFERRGLFSSALLIALFEHRNPPLKLEVCGNDASFTSKARHVFYPGKILLYQPSDARPEIRPCIGTRCLEPITDLAQTVLSG